MCTVPVVPGAVARIALNDAERQALEATVLERSTLPRVAMRTRILWLAADGVSISEIAARVGVSLPTVRLWLSRFGEQRVGGLVGAPRSGRPRTVEWVALVLSAAYGPPPNGAACWSPSRLSAVTGVPSSTVHRILRANGLRAPDWSSQHADR